VLIRGESGTGKELIARALHYNSTRAAKRSIAVSCAALTETLLESELFGHREECIYGRGGDKSSGRFEMANQGTLFLDEIAEISPPIQVKLFARIAGAGVRKGGGNQSIKVDVRLVAATNKDLEKAVAAGIPR